MCFVEKMRQRIISENRLFKSYRFDSKQKAPTGPKSKMITLDPIGNLFDIVDIRN